MKYDVLIIGNGIAGSSLAYNLQKEGIRNVLVIDCNDCQKGYDYRIVYGKDIYDYNLSYCSKYSKLKVGAYDEVYFEVDHDFYAINYKSICNNFNKKTDCVIKNEKALRVYENTLITNKSKYRFKYLVDCTGNNFFLRKRLGFSIPRIYWLVESYLLKNRIDQDTYYFMYADSTFFEDIYPMGDYTLYGNWVYTMSRDFDGLIPHDRLYLKKLIKKPDVVLTNRAILPVEPTLPLAYKNFAFLGDSFGCATPSAGMGIRAILDASLMLADAIKKNNLKLYERRWKRKNLNQYLKIVAIKTDQNFCKGWISKKRKYPKRTDLVKEGINDPGIFVDMIKDKKNNKLGKLFPFYQKILVLIQYLVLKSKNLDFFPFMLPDM